MERRGKEPKESKDQEAQTQHQNENTFKTDPWKSHRTSLTKEQSASVSPLIMIIIMPLLLLQIRWGISFPHWKNCIGHSFFSLWKPTWFPWTMWTAGTGGGERTERQVLMPSPTLYISLIKWLNLLETLSTSLFSSFSDSSFTDHFAPT